MSAPRLLGGPEEVAADPAEAVDADANGHRARSFAARRDSRASATVRRSCPLERPNGPQRRRRRGAWYARRVPSARAAGAASSSAMATRAVPAAGAAEGDRQVALALGLVGRQEQCAAGPRAGRGTPPSSAWLEHVVAHRLVEAGERAQLLHPVRVGQEAARPCTMSTSSGRPCLKPKLSTATCSRDARASRPNAATQAVLELVHVELGGVDDEVGGLHAARSSSRSRSIDVDQRRRPRRPAGACAGCAS